MVLPEGVLLAAWVGERVGYILDLDTELYDSGGEGCRIPSTVLANRKPWCVGEGVPHIESGDRENQLLVDLLLAGDLHNGGELVERTHARHQAGILKEDLLAGGRLDESELDIHWTSKDSGRGPDPE